MKPEMRAMDAVHIMIAKIAAALPAIGSGVMVMLAFLLAAWLLRMLIRRFVPESHPNAARLIGLLMATVFWGIVLLGVVCGLVDPAFADSDSDDDCTLDDETLAEAARLHAAHAAAVSAKRAYAKGTWNANAVCGRAVIFYFFFDDNDESVSIHLCFF